MTGIIGLAATIVGLLAWWIKRRANRNDDPKVQRERDQAVADRVVARHDGVGVNVFVQRELDRLQDAAGGDGSGPGDRADSAGANNDVHE